jgi:hypothetical protein
MILSNRHSDNPLDTLPNSRYSLLKQDILSQELATTKATLAELGGFASATLREAIWLRHYSIRTKQAYIDWVRRYISL